MDERHPLKLLFDFNATQFHAALDGIDDHRATRPLGTTRHRIDHIVAHMVDARAHLARLLNARPPLDVLDVLEATESFADLGDRVPLSVLRDTWDLLMPPLHHALAMLTDRDLAGPATHSFPIRDGSLTGALTFLAQHEAYHLGQLGLLRRELGLPALTYPPADG